MNIDIQTLKATTELLRERLLASRINVSHWEGQLSSSALSTAIASFALTQVDRAKYNSLINDGLHWLSVNQNADGGWGDTTDSPSNLSTTMLCYSAMAIPDRPASCAESISKTESWLHQTVGSLEPQALAEAVDRQYGKDKTFSAPILTMCALAGRLGNGNQTWGLIRPLPFELAVFPNRLYKWLRLPVVSYALPALIAIGQTHFHHCTVRNPFSRIVRGLARQKSLRVLKGIQPVNGGFLEASPLTGFVVMSLASCGLSANPVVGKGAEFLASSVREDGSWPIDTNLATWVTTLSVNALAAGDIRSSLPESERQVILEWLLRCQHTEPHVYTGAAPGGWAWSDLPGAVPDADDTAGALLALHNLDPSSPVTLRAACTGIRWILGLQNSDGGIPTFCRGWTSLPFDKSAPDITAHALGAMGIWLPSLPLELQSKTRKAMTKIIRYLSAAQRKDGSWIPLWFGNQLAPKHENPVYGTSRVLSNLALLPEPYRNSLSSESERAIQWLLSAQNTNSGWGAPGANASSVEETALAVDALAQIILIRRKQNSNNRTHTSSQDAIRSAVSRGSAWLVPRIHEDLPLAPSPIGLYFASLWYSEQLYPLVFALSALTKAHAAFTQ